jgi:hypothetical protein
MMTVSVSAMAEPQDFDAAGLFRSSCAPCHGVNGMGGGPVAAALKDPVPVLATPALRHGGAFPEDYVYGMIDGRALVRTHGSRTMPVWRIELLLRHHGAGAEGSTAFVIDALVQHIKSLQVE